ncbi:MAG: hypothetical protein GF350_01255 [Chitinivibrionales bacterium]|nr:hypothetical protein [Chitinivibrionales bacterium]
MHTAIENFIRWRIRQLAGLLCKIIPPRPGKQTVRKILCLISGGLGDRLMALPALRELKKQYPQATMTVAWMHGSLDIVDQEFHAVVNNAACRIVQIFQIALRNQDIVYVNIVGIFNVFSELLVSLSRAPVRIGPAPHDSVYTKRIYTDICDIKPGLHSTAINLAFTESGRFLSPVPYPVSVPKHRKRKKSIGIHPGVKTGYEMKQWPVGSFLSLARRLDSPDIEIVIIAGPDEPDTVGALFAGHAFSVLIPHSITDLFTEIASLDLLIANDSGPAHVAAATHTPVIVLFGPTDPQKVAPVFEKGEIITAGCECSPCFDTANECKNSHRCMNEIQVEKVLKSVTRMVS